MKVSFYVYWCTDCEIFFAIQEDFEDHTIIVCPVCKLYKYLEDAGSGDMEYS